jgi:hypothetical protein
MKGGRMKISEGVVPSIIVILAFLVGATFGCTEGYKKKQKDVLIAKCEQSKGIYDFCQKKTETKEYYVLKEEQ